MLKYGKNQSFNPQKFHPLNIDRQSVSFVPDSSSVLEIGCATGSMGACLRRKKNCFVVGVEERKEEAKEAKKQLQKIIRGNIEEEKTFQQIRKCGEFEVVLASAVVEHLSDPWRALHRWKTFLKRDGILIVTTSNIVHWRMRIKILLGKFEYEEYGILDNTHLRFFTPKTFRELVESTGYSIISYSIDPVGGGYPKVSYTLSKLFPNVFAYQMLIVARPK